MSYESYKCSSKALILSKVSDYFFMLSVFCIVDVSGSLSPELLFFHTDLPFEFFIYCFIFLLTKTAIFPFHSWLI